MNYKEPWTAVVQEMVREQLVPNVALGAVEAVGAWLGDDLYGVAAWKYEGEICHSVLLAVRVGRRRAGVGSRLKGAVLASARTAGATAVVSHVHWDNDAMICLNAKFGANVERIAGDVDYCRCIIPLDR